MKLNSIFSSVLFTVTLLCVSTTYAEIVNIVETATYTMDESETLSVASRRAVELARRQASERVAVYLESYSKSVNNVLTEDIVKVTSATIMKDRITPIIKNTLDPNGQINISATVDVDIDTNKIQYLIENARLNNEFREDYIRLLNNFNDLQKKHDLLKKNLQDTSDGGKRNHIIEELKSNEKEYIANEYFEKGLNLQNNGNSEMALTYYDKAIELNPYDDFAYNNRGNTYANLEKYQLALNDLNYAIKLNPNKAVFYFNRGCVYDSLKPKVP